MTDCQVEQTNVMEVKNISPVKPKTTKKRNLSPPQVSNDIPAVNNPQDEKYILVKITQREFNVMLHLVEEYEKQKEKKREYYRRKTEDCKPNGLYKPSGVKYKIFEL
jgi:hypothetical protein